MLESEGMEESLSETSLTVLLGSLDKTGVFIASNLNDGKPELSISGGKRRFLSDTEYICMEMMGFKCKIYTLTVDMLKLWLS